MPLLRRYWFEFALSGEDLRRFGYFPAYGVGVTAYDYEDALASLWKSIVRGDELPKIAKVIANVDVSRLIESQAFAQTRLLPHLGCPAWRGVWHPAINLWYGPDVQQ